MFDDDLMIHDQVQTVIKTVLRIHKKQQLHKI